MSDPRVISATFSDWRTVKGRKVLQLVMEVPLEQQQEVLTMLGPPDSVGSKWCAIALLAEKPSDDERTARARALAQAKEDEARALQASEASGSPKDKPKRERSLAEQCAITCADIRFQEWIVARDEPHAARYVREVCGVTSRSELSHNHTAANKWRKLYTDYQNYLAQKNYGEIARP